MAKVITFSRVFPDYHPKAGQPTNFVEAIYRSLFLMKVIPKELEESYNQNAFLNGFTKHHTIRSGKRFKKGDFFSPRVWGNDVNPKSGKIGPYHSKQILIAPDTEILQTIDVNIDKDQGIYINGKILSVMREEELANNDGLNVDDFFDWFNVLPFEGQIIIWNDAAKY